eukprot:ctg_1452.g341
MSRSYGRDALEDDSAVPALSSIRAEGFGGSQTRPPNVSTSVPTTAHSPPHTESPLPFTEADAFARGAGRARRVLASPVPSQTGISPMPDPALAPASEVHPVRHRCGRPAARPWPGDADAKLSGSSWAVTRCSLSSRDGEGGGGGGVSGQCESAAAVAPDAWHSSAFRAETATPQTPRAFSATWQSPHPGALRCSSRRRPVHDVAAALRHLPGLALRAVAVVATPPLPTASPPVVSSAKSGSTAICTCRPRSGAPAARPPPPRPLPPPPFPPQEAAAVVGTPAALPPAPAADTALSCPAAAIRPAPAACCPKWLPTGALSSANGFQKADTNERAIERERIPVPKGPKQWAQATGRRRQNRNGGMCVDSPHPHTDRNHRCRSEWRVREIADSAEGSRPGADDAREGHLLRDAVERRSLVGGKSERCSEIVSGFPPPISNPLTDSRPPPAHGHEHHGAGALCWVECSAGGGSAGAVRSSTASRGMPWGWKDAHAGDAHGVLGCSGAVAGRAGAAGDFQSHRRGGGQRAVAAVVAHAGYAAGTIAGAAAVSRAHVARPWPRADTRRQFWRMGAGVWARARAAPGRGGRATGDHSRSDGAVRAAGYQHGSGCKWWQGVRAQRVGDDCCNRSGRQH